MFGLFKIKPGSYVFIVKRDDISNFIILGRILSEDNKLYKIKGSFFRPIGLLEKIKNGRADTKLIDVVNNPDPNNCIFMLLDKIDYGYFDDFIDPRVEKITPINENRYFVLDSWLKENLSDLFSDFFNSSSSEQRSEARRVLLEKMNSLLSQELKEHVYAVVRSARIL